MMPSRCNFSTSSSTTPVEASATKSDESIFASADYFKDVQPEEIDADSSNFLDGQVLPSSLKAGNVDELMWMDANDSMGTTMSLASKDVDNLVQGIQSYGFSEALVYYETLTYDTWMFFAETQGMGMGFGLISAALACRVIFAPFIVYSQTLGMKMKLLQPD